MCRRSTSGAALPTVGSGCAQSAGRLFRNWEPGRSRAHKSGQGGCCGIEVEGTQSGSWGTVMWNRKSDRHRAGGLRPCRLSPAAQDDQMFKVASVAGATVDGLNPRRSFFPLLLDHRTDENVRTRARHPLRREWRPQAGQIEARFLKTCSRAQWRGMGPQDIDG